MKLYKLAIVTGASALMLSGCATFKKKTLKAPCGPTAGQTDPCGNRIPLNLEERQVFDLRAFGKVDI